MAPPAALQFCNGLLHRYHWIGVVVNWVVWTFVLLVVGPVGIVVLSLYSLYELLWAVRYNTSIAAEPHQAIVITGCDTGFGRDLALAAVKEGYTVFAGCLDATKCTIDGAKVLSMDVTNDKQVQTVFKTVREWVAQEKGRYLYALVNNAGVGVAGPIDWLDMSDFEFCMNVNYYGLLRTTKEALPIFRSQEQRGRVVNITSMAGLVGTPVTSAYCASKNAANVASHALRAECQSFLDVVTINPSIHDTPLLRSLERNFTKEYFEKLPSDLQSAYGLEFTLGLRKQTVELPLQWAWKAEVVLGVVLHKVLRRTSPLPSQVLVGTDARYALIALRILPPWLVEFGQNLFAPLPTPAFCENRNRGKKED